MSPAGISRYAAWTNGFPRPLVSRVAAVRFASCLATALFGGISSAAEPTAAALAQFEAEVRPILVRRCYECHSEQAEEIAGDLLLDGPDGWLAGGFSGEAVVPGDVDASLMSVAIGYENPDLQMPPKSRLPQREIDVLNDWIAAGAPAPTGDRAGAESPGAAFDDAAASAALVAQRKAEHWAWRPIRRPEPPVVSSTDWPLDDVDRFLLARLERAEIAPAPDASRPVWLRRVTYDLRGLPPTPAEIEAFLADEHPHAYERVVDRLLGETAFGETWAVHWLDLVRFAESKGHEQDFDVPHAWRYRDYVIRAFNANVPYDQFVREHVAGDLLAAPRIDPETRTNQSAQGTAFWLLGEATHSPVDIRGEEADRVANSLDVFGKTFLGLTIGCVRCHDHKFDALTAADYYALGGYLQSSSPTELNVADPAATEAAILELQRLHSAASGPIVAAETAALAEQVRQLPQLLEFLLTSVSQAAPGDGAESPVAYWSKELNAAAGEPGHPLHLLGVAAAAPAGERRETAAKALVGWSDRLAESAAATVDEVIVTQKDGELNLVETRRRFDPVRDVIVDFADPRFTSPSHENWITQGRRFGPSATPAGTPLFSLDATRPLARITPQASACGDVVGEAFTGLYRTRTFEVTGDVLWYRFRGSAEVFLDVDSHRTVAGPLHAVVNKKLDSPEAETWFGHTVSDYLGHRVHVEFKPTGPFELYEVRFGASAPPTPTTIDASFAARIAESSPESVVELAERLCEEMASIVASASDARCDDASLRLVNWLLDRREQLPRPNREAWDRVQQLGARYAAARERIEAAVPEAAWSLALLDGDAENEFIHLRGSHRRLAEQATPRRFLHALDGPEGMEIDQGSGRLQLAERLVAEDNPLTARVFVNRLWHHLFGRGIVPTVDDFGAMGEPPSHPELLDFLASEFRSGGWDVQAMIRRLVLSRAYRQASTGDPAADAADPTNVLLHRAPVRRLTAEKVRDAVLAVSGRLDASHFGPSVRIHITDFMRSNRSPSWSGPADGDDRRSLYVEVRRNHMSHFLAAFDRPTPAGTIGRRFVSNTAAQPLILLNDPLMHELAKAWAEHLVDEFDDDAAACQNAYMAAFARPPSGAERQRVVDYVAAAGESSRRDAWSDVCLTLLNVKEFIFLH